MRAPEFWGAALAALVLPSAAAAQACPAADARASGPAATVRYLADDALEGRLAGSLGERCAGEFIAAEFRRLGLRAAGENTTYFQSLPLASVANPHAPAGSGRNVVAVLEGSDPALRGEAVVVGAHYDHLGRGQFGSLAAANETNAIHNGADDNASGVAVLLEAARRLAAGPRPARSVVFIAFTGEEGGLLGSRAYARNPAVPLARTRAMINMDMVGRLGAGPLIVNGTGTAAEWDGLLTAAAGTAGVQVARKPDGYGPSDHTAFYERDVPVLHFFTNTHADYHKPSDDAQKIDVAGLEKIAAIVTRLATDVAGRPAALTLVRGVGAPQAQASSGGYGAYLGSVPDFSPVERGVLLSGVRGGSPAEQAGIKPGDTIVGLGSHDVKDLQGLTDALRAHKPGDKVEVTVLRDGKEVKVTAVLGKRD